MRIILITILLSFGQNIIAQSANSYSLRWNVDDSVSYKVAFDQLELTDENQNTSDTASLEHFLTKVLEQIAEEFKDFNLETSIKKKGQLYDVTFYFGGFPILNGEINDSGNLLTEMEVSRGNFFKIFYDLPDQQIKVGDTWTSNLKLEKDFDGIIITDSTKSDKVTFEELIKIEGDQLAILKYELRESYVGNYLDEDNVRKEAIFDILFDTKGSFNISKGKWDQLNGVVIFDFKFPKQTKSVMKIGLIEKKNE